MRWRCPRRTGTPPTPSSTLTGDRPRIFFQRVPEPKTAKNRVHLDTPVGGPRGTPLEDNKERVHAEVDRLVALGATEVESVEELSGYHVVMRDPEGNEFCLTAAPRDG